MEIPRHWRIRKQRYQLAGSVCNECGYRSFPPRTVCPQCRQDTLVGFRTEEPIAVPESVVNRRIRVK